MARITNRKKITIELTRAELATIITWGQRAKEDDAFNDKHWGDLETALLDGLDAEYEASKEDGS